jgi:hypothetical protein
MAYDCEEMEAKDSMGAIDKDLLQELGYDRKWWIFKLRMIGFTA